jgi:hypothetical protein
MALSTIIWNDVIDVFNMLFLGAVRAAYPTREQQRVVATGTWWHAYFAEQEAFFKDVSEGEVRMPPLDSALLTWLPDFQQPIDEEKREEAVRLLD